MQYKTLESKKFLALPERKVYHNGRYRGKVTYEFSPKRVYSLENVPNSYPCIHRVEQKQESNLFGIEVPSCSVEYKRLLKWIGFKTPDALKKSSRNLLRYSGARAHKSREEVLALFS